MPRDATVFGILFIRMLAQYITVIGSSPILRPERRWMNRTVIMGTSRTDIASSPARQAAFSTLFIPLYEMEVTLHFPVSIIISRCHTHSFCSPYPCEEKENDYYCNQSYCKFAHTFNRLISGFSVVATIHLRSVAMFGASTQPRP